METQFLTILTCLLCDLNIFSFFALLRALRQQFWHSSSEIQGFDFVSRNEKFCGNLQSGNQFRGTLYVTTDSHVCFRAI